MALKTLKPRLGLANTFAVPLPPKTTDPFYLSPAWRELLASIIARRGRCCQDPECPSPHPPITRIYGDHIIERKDGGPELDERNIMLRCATAHGRKTAAERGRRAASNPPGGGSKNPQGEGA